MSRFGWVVLALFALTGVMFAMSVRKPGPTDRAARFEDVRDAPSGLVVPVAGVARSQLADSWQDARGGGTRRHQALDIAAPRGTPVLAAQTGTVEKLFESNDGGITAYVRSADGGWIAYYAHLAGYAAGLAEGADVRAAQAIGYVGDTGNAGAGNTHLHFGLHRMSRGERWWQGEPVNPHPLLAGKAGNR